VKEEDVEVAVRLLEVGLPQANQRPKIGVASAALPLLGDYMDAVNKARGEPVAIPRGEQGLAILSSCQGLLITGVGITDGYDVPEGFWADQPEDEWRWENLPELLDQCRWLLGIVIWARRRRIPTIGAGLGAQLLVVEAGGKLIRHVERHEFQHDKRPRGIPRHIEMVPGSWLTAAWAMSTEDEPTEGEPEDELPTTAEVICSHHQAPDPESLPDTVKVVAWTDDGVPHAWELLDPEGKAWGFGLQFEPQHSEDPQGYGNLLLRWFIRQLSE
jgi:gamma-glutamyl-gamma-aminobutyrate hydrolase PuuD